MVIVLRSVETNLVFITPELLELVVALSVVVVGRLREEEEEDVLVLCI
jgi:hypothetical protein